MISNSTERIYGRKHGMALTLEVLAPGENANGIGIVFVASGGWSSSRALAHDLTPRFIEPLARRGYTVFVVVPRSQPRYTIPDMKEDVQRSIRFVRYHAAEYSINAQRLGLYGLSAGGHLSLLAGLTASAGDANAEDPVERESCAVQAIAEFYGPTDFLNYGAAGKNAVGRGVLGDLKAAFDFCELDPETNTYQRITDTARVEEIARQCSPINHLRAGAPPILIIHGEADLRVPLQQSSSFLEKAQQVGALVELKVVPGQAHGWDDMSGEVESVIDWFEQNLKVAPKATNK
jgi:acetyl esterase/lipase